MTHDAHAPSRDEVLVGIDRPTPPILTTLSLVAAGIGLLIFIIGLFINPDRVWQSLYTNWLYFASVSSAGVMFVAAQRITTARWSREIIRFLEGYVAFLPVAFVFLLLSVFLGKNYIFPWTHEAYPGPEKALYYGPVFFTVRVIFVMAIITALSLWYIYTCVRLHVGLNPDFQ